MERQRTSTSTILNPIRIKSLDKVVKKNGFTYTQIRASNGGYIYEQRENGHLIGFEVFRHRVKQYPDISGNGEYSHYVGFPNNEDFGSWAWSWFSLEAAEKCFRKYIEKT